MTMTAGVTEVGKEIIVNTANGTYPIYIRRGLQADFAKLLHDKVPQGAFCLVSDSRVAPLYAEPLRRDLEALGRSVILLTVPAGESSKQWATVQPLLASMVGVGLTRSDTVVAVGGGVVGDLAGFLAAIYLRGIRLVQIPTSLLAQVDSSVGGKVAVDLAEGKNLVGAFKQPAMVLIDTLVLATLDEHFYRDGLGEVVKYGCIADSDLFRQLENLTDRASFMEQAEEIIARCCQCKADFVEADTFDTGARMALNFGHTLGHALEAATGYTTYSHGEAVALGMVQLTAHSERLGLTAKGTTVRLRTLLERLGLPVSFPPIAWDTLAPYLKNDKKNLQGALHVVLLAHIGKYFLHQEDLAFLGEALLPSVTFGVMNEVEESKN